jgi:hypothetical protein
MSPERDEAMKDTLILSYVSSLAGMNISFAEDTCRGEIEHRRRIEYYFEGIISPPTLS